MKWLTPNIIPEFYKGMFLEPRALRTARCGPTTTKQKVEEPKISPLESVGRLWEGD